MTESDAVAIHYYLTSQALVCAKYATKQTSTFEATEARVKQLSSRFDPTSEQSEKGLYMYGGFKVTGHNGEFLGLINTGASETPGFTEIGVRYRPEAWNRNHKPANLETEYTIEQKDRLTNDYEGLGTVAVCALWEYTKKQASEGHTILGKKVEGMRAVCMIDNPGGWMAQAKLGMELDPENPVDAVEAYGPEIRYRTLKRM